MEFAFHLVAPERRVFAGPIRRADLPGCEGDFGVLAEHAPFVTVLRAGVLRVHGGDLQPQFLRGGFAEVSAGGLTVLARGLCAVAELQGDALADALHAAERALEEAHGETRRRARAQILDALKALRGAPAP